MIPAEVKDRLDDAGIAFCLIGAHALAVHGVARYTADVDLLTMDASVLGAGFWAADPPPEIRRGDAVDPLEGLVRFEAPPVDVIVGRGAVMRGAVEHAVHEPLVDAPIATAEWLALLKVQAGGVQDLADVHLLVEARRLAGENLRPRIEERLDLLDDWGRQAWARVVRDLDATN